MKRWRAAGALCYELLMASSWRSGFRSALVAIAVTIASASLLGGCTSPTLPLPPPAIPSTVVGSEPNTYRLSSDRGALPNALVIVINRDPALAPQDRVNGTFADTEGSWAMVVIAKPGDVLDVSQEDGANRSPTSSIQLK